MKKENKYKKLRQETMEIHKEEVEKKLLANNRDLSNENYSDYKSTSKFRWWDWLIIILLPWAIFGLIILVCWLSGDIKFSEYILMFTGLLILFVWIIMSWKSNKNSSEYYNDSRRRYAKVYDGENGMHRKIRIITLTTGFIVGLSSLIVFFAM